MNTFQFLRLKEKNKDMLTNSDIATTKIILSTITQLLVEAKL